MLVGYGLTSSVGIAVGLKTQSLLGPLLNREPDVAAQLEAHYDSMRRVMIGLTLLTLVGATAMAALYSREIGRSIRSMSSAAKAIADGRLDLAPPQPTRVNELHTLGEALFAMQQSLVRAIDTERQKAALEKEAAVGAAVQALFLPRKTALTRAGYALAGYHRAAAICSGDWWHHCSDDPAYVRILLADVTGHGVGSALVTATASGMLAQLERHAPSDPRELLESLHQGIRKLCAGEYNMCVSLLQLDCVTRVTTWVNAGAPPLFISKPSGEIEAHVGYSTLLGGDDLQLSSMRFSPDKAARILAFTDGLAELQLPTGMPLGHGQLKRWFEDSMRLDVVSARDDMVKRIDACTAGQPLKDDLTFVVITSGRA